MLVEGPSTASIADICPIVHRISHACRNESRIFLVVPGRNRFRVPLLNTRIIDCLQRLEPNLASDQDVASPVDTRNNNVRY
jgi:hypothetical protein